MNRAEKCRVLFVEDDAIVAMLIEDLLLELGVEVVGPAYGLETALHLARTADVEAAVLDIQIKGEFSYPVADALLARGIPIIFATGYGERAIPERFKDVPTLHKPFESARFHQVLTEALSDAPCEIS